MKSGESYKQWKIERKGRKMRRMKEVEDKSG
jgi:hypothetical protein